MKDHFPFTDYDFYGYLASGGFALAIGDYLFNNAAYLTRADWTFAQIALCVAAAYVVGHLIAMLAQSVLETLVMNKALAKPMDIQLGFKHPSRLERMVGALVGRYYSTLPNRTSEKILRIAASELDCAVEDFSEGESIFLLGFKKSFSDEKLRHRIDDFRNQYGFCRNIAFVGLTATPLLIWSALCQGNNEAWGLAIVTALIFVGMFIRFVKFLSSFQAEVIRSVC